MKTVQSLLVDKSTDGPAAATVILQAHFRLL